jgi:glutamate N-acetyltransferase/amino-acid N-acetyltransferase
MVNTEIDFIDGGTITTPRGFRAGAIYSGIKEKAEGILDLGILLSEAPCTVAASFTTSKIKSAPVKICLEKVQTGNAVGLVVNSGNANAYTGEQGIVNAREMVEMAAETTGENPEDILIASTGVTGKYLPMEIIRDGITQITLSHNGGHELAKAILTTDTVTKETAIAVKFDGSEFTIGGIAKGSGMIHPGLATMFCFLTTDAVVDLDFLRSALRKAVDVSFNMISVDDDMSPSDTVLIMANGLSGNEPISIDSKLAEPFQQALEKACIYLAKELARDGEGATKLIEVTVNGATSNDEARLAARTIVASSLFKTAMYGADPNWGRIMMALGQSGIEIEESKIDIYLGDIQVAKEGRPFPFDIEKAIQLLRQNEVFINVNLNLRTASATAWGCDLSHEYITINSQYMT